MKKLTLVKRIASVLLASVLVAGALSACGGGNSQSQPAATDEAADTQEAEAAEESAEAAAESEGPLGGPFKVGVATIFEGESWEIQRDYFNNELAPALNMEFMFSEKIDDANALMDFVDQAFAAGCDGLINYRTMDADVAQAARKCEEYGMVFVTQNSKVIDEVADLPTNIGHCGADPVKMGDAYKALFQDLLSDDEPHSLVFYTCGAVQQMAASHYYTAYAILEAYQEAYGLTYDDTIDSIINRQEPGNIETGRDDVKIYLFPGIQGMNDGSAITGCQTALQTGDYDIFATPAMFQLFTNSIDEIEKSLNKDIKIVGTVAIDDQTKTGFETLDSFGNPVLNAGMVNPLCPAGAINALECYNGLVGQGDTMKEGGKAVLVGVAPFVCMDAETYNGITQLDRNADTYIIKGEDLAALRADSNPNVTINDVSALLDRIADVDYVLNLRGIQ